eukprot:TRINITY_DN10421_c1_g5_i1.p1 TRINITY_DN10421_c1_g5~~TRINITY_DN10421_c1_g5_i1.p1  ORF type:complete len:629 (+),score=245.81 TRINITY_DN10421_c1_g5_i1:116-2002(+)
MAGLLSTAARTALGAMRQRYGPVGRVAVRWAAQPPRWCSSSAKEGAVERKLEELLLHVAREVDEDKDVARRVSERLAELQIDTALVTARLEDALESATGETGAHTEPPTMVQLRMVFFAAACPFIGFGLLDNALMILFGDYIDQTLCVAFGASTMLAAALGNTVSDAAGVYSGGLVEDIAARYGITAPPMSRFQEELRVTKLWERLGQLIGIIVGCILGMFPLLFIDTHRAEKLKQGKRMDDMYQAVVEELADMLDAEAAMLMFVDGEEGELYTRATDNLPEFRSPIREGVKGAVALSGKFLNIDDIRETEYFNEQRHCSYLGSGIQVRSVLCMPILGAEDKIVGVVEIINKKDAPGFSEKDEDVLSAVCSHIATSVLSVDGSEHAFKQTIELCEKSLRNQGTRLNAAQNTRIDFLFRLVVEEVASTLDAEAAQLLIVDREANELYTKVSDHIPPFRSPISRGVMGTVVSQKRVVCVDDLPQSDFFDPERHLNYQNTGLNVKSILCVPIFDSAHDVIGVIEVINKKEEQQFSSRDMSFLNAVASHLALNMQGPGTSLKSVLRMMVRQESLLEEEDPQQRFLSSFLCRCFDEVDVNGDGVISRDEFELAGRRIVRASQTYGYLNKKNDA